MTTTNIFISAATIDLENLRNLLKSLLDKSGFHVIVQDKNLGMANTVRELLCKNLEESHCVIHLAGLGYGSPADNPFPHFPDFKCSWTQFEYYYTHWLKQSPENSHKKVFAFVCGPELSQQNFEEQGTTEEKEEKRLLQLKHRQRVQSGLFSDTPLQDAPRTLAFEAPDFTTLVGLLIDAATDLAQDDPAYLTFGTHLESIQTILEQQQQTLNSINNKLALQQEQISLILTLLQDGNYFTTTGHIRNSRKDTLHLHIHDLIKSTSGTQLPFLTRDARDINGEIFNELADWSIPRSIEIYSPFQRDDQPTRLFSKQEVIDFAKTCSSCHLTIVGDAGCGKTSYLNQLANELGKQWTWDAWNDKSSKSKIRLPLFLTWSDVFDLLGENLVETAIGKSEPTAEAVTDKFFAALAMRLGLDNADIQWMRDLRHHHGYIFILDGLDEAIIKFRELNAAEIKGGEDDTGRLLRAVTRFIDNLAARESVVISSTRSSLLAFTASESAGFGLHRAQTNERLKTGLYQLAPWSESDAKEFVCKALLHYPQKADTIIAHFDKQSPNSSTAGSPLKDIWKDPFLLSVWCNLQLDDESTGEDNIKTPQDIYGAAVRYLSKSRNRSEVSQGKKDIATKSIIEQFVDYTYFNDARNTRSLLIWEHEDLASVLTKLLRNTTNQQTLTEIGGNVKQAIDHITSTGFFVWEERKVGNSKRKTCRFVDYRIFEFMLACFIHSRPSNRFCTRMDKVLAKGTNPLVLYHVSSLLPNRLIVVWWVFTRLSSICSDLRIEKTQFSERLPVIMRERTQRVISFASAYYKIPSQRNPVLESENLGRNRQLTGSVKNFILAKINRYLTVCINRNFLRIIATHLKSRERHRFYTLREIGIAEINGAGQCIGIRWGRSEPARPLFDYFTQIFWDSEPTLYLKPPVRTIRYFDSSPSDRFIRCIDLVKVRPEEPDGCPADCYTITEENLHFIPKNQIAKRLIGKVFGDNDLIFPDTKSEINLYECVFLALNMKTGALFNLLFGIRPIYIPFGRKWIKKIMESLDLVLLVMRDAFSTVIVAFIFMTAIIWLYSHFGLGERAYSTIFPKPQATTFPWVLLLVLFPSYLVTLWLRSSMTYKAFFPDSPIFFLSGLLEKLTEINTTASRERIIEFNDSLINVVGIPRLIEGYDRCNSLNFRNHGPDYWIAKMAVMPFYNSHFTSVSNSSQLPTNLHWSNDSIELFADFLHRYCKTPNLFSPDHHKLPCSILETPYRRAFAPSLAQFFGCKESDIESIIENDSFPKEGLSTSNDELLKALHRFLHPNNLSTFYEDKFTKEEKLYTAFFKATQKAERGDIKLLYLLLKKYNESCFTVIERWLYDCNKSGNRRQIVANISKSLAKVLSEERNNRRRRYNVDYFIGFLLDTGQDCLGEETVDFCIECLRSLEVVGFGDTDPGILSLIRSIPAEVLAKKEYEMLAALRRFRTAYEWFGIFEDQRNLLGRTISESGFVPENSTLYRFTRRLHPFALVPFFFYFNIRQLIIAIRYNERLLR
jgi:hypothetical protein